MFNKKILTLLFSLLKSFEDLSKLLVSMTRLIKQRENVIKDTVYYTLVPNRWYEVVLNSREIVSSVYFTSVLSWK